jgi:hypothetical protein
MLAEQRHQVLQYATLQVFHVDAKREKLTAVLGKGTCSVSRAALTSVSVCVCHLCVVPIILIAFVSMRARVGCHKWRYCCCCCCGSSSSMRDFNRTGTAIWLQHLDECATTTTAIGNKQGRGDDDGCGSISYIKLHYRHRSIWTTPFHSHTKQLRTLRHPWKTKRDGSRIFCPRAGWVRTRF